MARPENRNSGRPRRFRISPIMSHGKSRPEAEQRASAKTRFRFDPAAMASWLIPFALIVYLGLEHGSFEQRVWSEIGIIAWWLVVLGLLAGAFAAARIGRNAWIALGLLAAFACWSALALIWTESSGRTVIELARVLAYLGIFVAAILAGAHRHPRQILGGVTAAIAVLATLALLSRLQPTWFPENEIPELLPGTMGRLAYPLGYWNALAGLIAIGLPLTLWGALSARRIAVRGLAGAAVPVMALASYYTFSRGGIVAAIAAILLLVILWPRRLALLAPGAVFAIGTAALIWQAGKRPSLADGLTTSTAAAQGDAMLMLVIAVALISGAAIAALAFALRRGRLPKVPAIPRPAAAGALAALAVAAVVAFLALGGPGRVADGFDDFKQAGGVGRDSSRLTNAGGNGRWQYWSAAVDAAADDPLTGIGPGTFVFYWAAHRDPDSGFARDAHSLFIEALAELGVVGLLLIGGFVVFILVIGVRRGVSSAASERRRLAAASAAAMAFTVAAGVDWLWEIAVVPVAFLLVAATIVAPDPALTAEPEPRRANAGWATVAIGAVAAVVAIVVIGVPMLSRERLAASQASFREGDLETALSKAQGAIDLAPYDAAPRMQEAFVYQAMMPPELARAAAAARAATDREPTNWETWYVLSQIEAQRRGREDVALRALRRARELGPYEPALRIGG